MKKIILIIAILLLSFTAINVWVSQNTPSQSDQVIPVADEAGRSPVAIGGAFTLTDHNGKVVQDSDYRGKIMLVFFGFTHCPDICPVTSRTLAEAMTLLGDQAANVAPLFITVDPERDTPEVLKTYFANIDKRITGLTGTQEQITAAASAYKAFYSKSGEDEMLPDDEEEEGHGHGGHGKSAEYSVDHSGYVYLMNKDGAYVKHFPYDAPAADIVAAVKQTLQQNP